MPSSRIWTYFPFAGGTTNWSDMLYKYLPVKLAARKCFLYVFGAVDLMIYWCIYFVSYQTMLKFFWLFIKICIAWYEYYVLCKVRTGNMVKKSNISYNLIWNIHPSDKWNPSSSKIESKKIWNPMGLIIISVFEQCMIHEKLLIIE